MILTIKTDQPEAEVSLFDGSQIVKQITWHGHRELSITLLQKIDDLLNSNDMDWASISAVVVFAGPGSFTGLRIGVTVANSIAYAKSIPVVGGQGSNWIQDGYEKLASIKIGQYVVPNYGGEANITKPRK